MKHYDELGNLIWAHHKQTQAAKTATNLATNTTAPSVASDRSTLLPAYQSILANPGYSSADKSAMRLSTLGGLGASFDSASDAASNRLARTRNSAGFGETLDELARERGRQTSTAEAGLESKFADTALSERDKALSGISNLYGVDSDTLAKLLNTGTAQYTGPLQGLAQSALAAGGEVGAAALKGGG